MELAIAVLFIALCCVCVFWRGSERENKENYAELRNLRIENTCLSNLSYYNYQIQSKKNLIVLELVAAPSSEHEPNYKAIEKALKEMEYFYSQRQKALDKYEWDKKELEERGK